LKLDYDIDNVVFGEYKGIKSKFRKNASLQYNIVNGFLDTENWNIELE